MNKDLWCLKYEFKKFKYQPKPEPVQGCAVKSLAFIPDDLLDCIAAAEIAEKMTMKPKNQIIALCKENDKLKADLRCLKYEVKNLKKIQAPQADAPAAITDDHYSLKSLDIENRKNQIFIYLNLSLNKGAFINISIYVFNIHFQIF